MSPLVRGVRVSIAPGAALVERQQLRVERSVVALSQLANRQISALTRSPHGSG
jgi:hypothetical protein